MTKHTLLLFILILLSSCSKDDENNNCLSNIEIATVAISESVITLKWVETQGYASNYEYGLSGFSFGNGISGSTTEETITLENLQPGQKYDFYLESICSESLTSDISKYTFTLLECEGLDIEKIVPRGFQEIDGLNVFGINWYPQLLGTNSWELAMLPANEVPNEQNIIPISAQANNSQLYVEIPEINPEVNYVFHIRRKCNDTFGSWVQKSISSIELQDFCQFEVDIENDTESFRIHTTGGVFANIIFVEEGQEFETGLTFNSNEIYTYGGNPNSIYNQYPDYFKPNTTYELYTRIQCGAGYSNYKFTKTYTTPLANAAVVLDSQIQGDNLIISYISDWGFNANFCRPYTNYTREIEYGIAGFTEGEGITINIEENVWPEQIIIPLSNFESNIEYEFTMRTKCNSITSEWNRHCTQGLLPRESILIP
ncbi:hypothetical protein [uncultured Aquimarina sp.]|uniref:hypothetical protein n=1 Tax=uncultured Aquimarina sp. TaxID=575652 RepID=UPI002603CFB1|nr:hypothetical protein [uncultured Aquimarina sp.]